MSLQQPNNQKRSSNELTEAEEALQEELDKLQQAAAEQESLNESISEEGSPEESGSESESGSEGQSPSSSQQASNSSSPGSGSGGSQSQGSQGSQNTPGSSQSQGSGSEGGENSGSDSLADKQEALRDFVNGIAENLEGLEGISENGEPGNPQDVAAELRRSAGKQGEAANAIAANEFGAAGVSGAASLEILREAIRELERSMDKEQLSRVNGTVIEKGYDQLIREYSRRISYEK